MIQAQRHACAVTRTLSAAGQERGIEVQAFSFGHFRLDLQREQLIGPRGRQSPRRQVFATLCMLLEAAPAVVTLDELLDRVWGRHALSPSAVPHVIAELRRALEDPARSPRYIETRHRRGYRIIPTVVRDLVQRPRKDARAPLPSATGNVSDTLLRLIDESREASVPKTSPRNRLERLYRAASNHGLTLLALQAQLALRGCDEDSPDHLVLAGGWRPSLA